MSAQEENNNLDTPNNSDKDIKTANKEQLNNTDNNDNNESAEKENINTFEKEAQEFKNKYLRTLAELENMKKYSFKQLEDANNYAISKFAKELLSVMDVFNKALESINELEITDTKFKSFIDGINLTKQELTKIFSKFHITSLDQDLIGENFDPNYHEALVAKPVEGKSDNIIFAVFEAGYKIKDKLLRPAKVGIVKN